jgi:hypothetical protein
MTSELATLLAAGIAAIASLTTLFVSVFAKRRVELREAQRSALEPLVVDLGSCLYSVVAMSKRLGMAKDDGRYRENKERATESARELDLLRRRVRYTLWGLNDGLHLIGLVPRWAELTRGNEAATKELISRATILRLAIDSEIRKCYLSGTAPSRRGLRRVGARAGALRKFYDEYKLERGPGAEELEGGDADSAV